MTLKNLYLYFPTMTLAFAPAAVVFNSSLYHLLSLVSPLHNELDDIAGGSAAHSDDCRVVSTVIPKACRETSSSVAMPMLRVNLYALVILCTSMPWVSSVNYRERNRPPPWPPPWSLWINSNSMVPVVTAKADVKASSQRYCPLWHTSDVIANYKPMTGQMTRPLTKPYREETRSSTSTHGDSASFVVVGDPNFMQSSVFHPGLSSNTILFCHKEVAMTTPSSRKSSNSILAATKASTAKSSIRTRSSSRLKLSGIGSTQYAIQAPQPKKKLNIYFTSQ